MTTPCNRRVFVEYSARLAWATCCGSALSACRAIADQAEDRSLLPIIDTHQHLWDLTRFRVPWLDEAPEVLKRSYVTRDYQEATSAAGVVKAVYMEIDVDPAQQAAEAEHVIELSRSDQHPTAAAVISGRPDSASFADFIRRYENVPAVKGVRQVLHTTAPRGLCLRPRFVASMRLLGELGKSYDLCMRPAELEDAIKLVDQCLDTRFIVDHCGNADPTAFQQNSAHQPWHQPDQWRRDMSQLARREHVVCKISGIIARAPEAEAASLPELLAPIINFCLDEFGPDRVVFGGDWPVCLVRASYQQWVDTLKAVIADRTEEQQRKLLHDNAQRLYDLK